MGMLVVPTLEPLIALMMAGAWPSPSPMPAARRIHPERYLSRKESFFSSSSWGWAWVVAGAWPLPRAPVPMEGGRLEDMAAAACLLVLAARRIMLLCVCLIKGSVNLYQYLMKGCTRLHGFSHRRGAG